MLFTNPLFLFVFLPAACLFFFLFARLSRNAAIAALLIASLICYLPWGVWPAALLIGSITLNFVIGMLLAAPWAITNARGRNALYLGGQSFNFGVLIWFKYQLIQLILHGASSPAQTFVMAAIPAGISFYTFHQAAFLADARDRETTVSELMSAVGSVRGFFASYVRYAAFVTFFPQLVIGPITYFREFYPQVERNTFGKPRRIDFDVGLTLIAIGLFKKLVIADNLEPLATSVFSAAEMGAALGMGTAWGGAFAYYFQLYFDFSGYSDVALGLARLVGIRYPMNFFSPLKAVGIIDFYRRWHMTLTRVIVRFVYTPLSLSGTRMATRQRLPKSVRRGLSIWLPLLINFEIIALWHGAHSTFILFGIIHGLWFVAETEARGTKAFKSWRRESPDWLRTLLGRAIFVGPMVLTFALFRAESLDGYQRLLSVMFGLDAEGLFFRATLVDRFALLMAALIVYLAPNSMQLLRNYRPGIYTFTEHRGDPGPSWLRWLKWQPDWRWAMFAGTAMLVALYFTSRQTPFLYQGF
ncbi:MBOAT family protein [Brevundimonas sp. A19_0]|uniref:MBOAT family O-acyltransferase n=1 Tax=Brevundimonas sp. A19_0 TaxID=2821087 RepID=UPI001ADCDCF1|nr:MBOAT family protein [Brevundimonas sp. A19_0]MBO9500286.1 MBOAT family protein [Brevundimonas sp. A19_0]